MTLQISRSTIQKLTHESSEIRQRTLDQIESKILRALAHDEEIEFKPAELFKQLIRWFGCKPIKSKKKVLQLMLALLQSKYGNRIFEQLGLNRCERELDKVKQLLMGGTSAELQLVENLLQHCNEYKRKKHSSLEEIVCLTDAMTISDAATSATIANSTDSDRIECLEEDYELCWSNPTVIDYNSMKFVAELLVNPLATIDELEGALQHLQFTMQDYPAEYFLQAPHTFLKLLELHERHEQMNCSLEEILNALVEYSKLLKERLRMRRKTLTYAPPLRSDNGDVRFPQKTQLKLEKVVQLLFDLCMNYFEDNVSEVLRNETLKIITIFELCLDMCVMQKLSIKTQIIIKMMRACKFAKESCTQSDHFTLQRIYQLQLLFLLQRVIEINAAVGSTVTDSTYLYSILQDFAVKICYPEPYETVKKFLRSAETAVDFQKNCKLLESYEQQFGQMVSLLKSPKNFNARDIIERSSDLLPRALETFASSRLVVTLYNSIVACLPQYMGSSALREKATRLLIKLLSMADENLAAPVFKCLANTCKQHFAALMNGVAFAAAEGCCQQKLLDCQIIGVPLSTSLLLKLAHSHFERTHQQIKESCEDILSMLLRSHHLLGLKWCRLLELLLPILPLLQCCTQAPKITDAIFKILGPDERQLPFLDLLKSNIRWLFHPDAQIRCECLTRLIYMLQSLDNSEQYMPNIMEICDLLPNDICLFAAPRSIPSIFNDVATQSDDGYLATLHNLLALLDSTDIEPMIRKTTLVQLNILCQHWSIAMVICRDGAYYFALKTLESALRKSSYVNYQDAALPAAGILSKLLLCDAGFREELANTENVYILLLRTLFLYGHNLHARHDAAISLFLLLFSTFLLVLPPGNKEAGIEVPALMANLQLPIKVRLRAEQSTETLTNSTQQFAIFKTSAEEKAYLRQLIAANFCDGLLKINSTWMDAQKQYDFNVELHLTQREWRLVKATQPMKNMRRFLKAAQNATVHTAVINAALSLKLQMVLNNTAGRMGEREVPNDIAVDLLKLLNKYLQSQPGNARDFLLFEHLLDLSDLCIQIKCTVVIEGLFNVLQDDFQHAFIILLQNPETTLRLYRKLAQTLNHLLHSVSHKSFNSDSFPNSPKVDPAAIFYSNLFELLFTVSKLLFEKRDLLRVRSLLSLLQLLSTNPLEMADDQLHLYCKRFLNLSISLKSFTQTGSQWQRDCLQLVCQLSAQMTQAEEIFKLSESFIRYLSGMCGHNDYRVRSLAWCVLAKVAHFDDGSATGAEQLKKELGYLPGGFMACCLSTLLDYAEVCLVRHLAGNLFTELLPKCMVFDEAVALLEQHAFYRFCHEALNVCVLNPMLPQDFDPFTAVANLNSCEVVSCLCRICIALLDMQPSYITELCSKTFMFKLYELLKVPTEEGSCCSQAYLIMCADICQVYAMCYVDNFVFLQRTLCRDQVWLRSFCLLLGKAYADAEDHVHVLQLLMAVCQDQTGFQYVCENIARAPELIVELFMQVFCVAALNSSMQRCALAVLSFLLIKSQLDMKYDFITFAQILEKPIELHMEEENSDCATTAYRKSAAELIFIELHRIFIHLYPLKACKFDSNPSPLKQQVCETISVLLKVSPLAQSAADNLKFLEKLLQIFNSHLEDFNTSCSTFIRRYGESKKLAIVNNFQLLLTIILNWFTNGTAVLSNETKVVGVTKLLIQIWPWLTYSAELKILILHVCSVLSEHSLMVCKKFATLISPHAHSILQLIIKIVTSETQRIKPANTENFPVISLGLRTAMNCCLCPEGRTTLLKARIFDTLDNMYPLNSKAPKLKQDIVHSWLLFWEVISRYSDSAKVRNVNALCAVANTSQENSTTRLLVLRILRNMSFANANRSALMNSTDFIYTVNEVISKRLEDEAVPCASYEEQMIVCVAIWKLISGGVKYVAMIRGSKLGKKIKMLFESLKCVKATTEDKKFQELPFAKDLYEVLEIIIGIFNE